MVIKVCKTVEWSDLEFESYKNCFNTVFDKKKEISYFKEKYIKVCDGYSYHSLLLLDTGEVVGACTVIPMYYFREGKRFKNGLAVDVFIHPTYRTDPLQLRRMYNKLKKELTLCEVVAVMAVPNDTAYPYWKNVVKWQDVGDLNYWVLPVRIGNVKKNLKCLNFLTIAWSYLICKLYILFVALHNPKSKRKIYSIDSNDTYYMNRFNDGYLHYKDTKISYAFKSYYEDGVNTTYIIDAREGKYRTLKSLVEVVNKIIFSEMKTDVIIYVGRIDFFQSLLFKVPKKMEPKRLPLTCDIISEDLKYTDMFDIDNWDFGLLNYDVR